MGGRDKPRARYERDDRWIREVSDDRLRGYARMLSTREAAYERVDGSVRSPVTQQHLSELVVNELNRRGQDGDLWKTKGQRDFESNFDADVLDAANERRAERERDADLRAIREGLRGGDK